MDSGLQKRRNPSEGGMPSFRRPKFEKKSEVERNRPRGVEERCSSSPSQLVFHLLQGCFGNRLLKLLSLLCRRFFSAGNSLSFHGGCSCPPPLLPLAYMHTLIGWWCKPSSWCALEECPMDLHREPKSQQGLPGSCSSTFGRMMP